MVLIVRNSLAHSGSQEETNRDIGLALCVDSLEFKQLLSFLFLFSHNLDSINRVSRKQSSILVVSSGQTVFS